MSLLFLLYNPNVSDPLTELIDPEMKEEDFLRIQADVMNGDVHALVEDTDFELGYTFTGAKEKYNELDPVEWDVLAMAAKAEWSHKLEQEQWQKEMKDFEVQQHEELLRKEQEESERKQKQIDANNGRFQASVRDNIHPARLQVNHAFGKSSLQRCTTVTAPCGQAQVLNFMPPKRDTVNNWFSAMDSETVNGAVNEEEDMDCTPPSVAKVQELSWQPFCKTDRFERPALHRTFTH